MRLEEVKRTLPDTFEYRGTTFNMTHYSKFQGVVPGMPSRSKEIIWEDGEGNQVYLHGDDIEYIPKPSEPWKPDLREASAEVREKVRNRLYTPEDVYGEGPYHVYYYKDIEQAIDYSYGRKPTNVDLSNYYHIGSIPAKDLEHVFMRMQGEAWSPNGEARRFITESPVRHTSMSVGDMVQYKGTLYMVMPEGFMRVKGTVGMLLNRP